MDKSIGPCQTSFLKNRQAIDNAMIIQEIIRHFQNKKRRLGNLIMKLDLEKAFDKLEWSFIHHTLNYFNFPKNIINLIMSCICTSLVTVLVNETRIEYFSPSRGIHQGDPMSPYIFILCIKVLAHNINQDLDSGKWDPIRISRHEPPLSHLYFAEDLVLLTNTKMRAA